MKKILIIFLASMMILLVGCDYLKVERQTLIDYRHTEEWTEYYIFDQKQCSRHYPEKWELLYEIEYADGHKDRQWESCTRFEYSEAREELGDIEP